MTDHVRLYRALVEEIERDIPVAAWRCDDLDLWPLARVALHHDIYHAVTAEASPPHRAALLRFLALLARPLLTLWRARRDLPHLMLWPGPRQAILLGDGVCLDHVDGTYQDRFGEAVMTAVEARGESTFLMQQGDLSRLPWRRPTFPAGLIQAWACLLEIFFVRPLCLPGHAAVMALLRRAGVESPSLARTALAARAREVCAGAWLFGLLLSRIRPRLAFVVTYYVGLGPAFLLACRRRDLLSIDLQHCPQEGAPQAYDWRELPAEGYSTLPRIFWGWSAGEAATVSPSPCHNGLYGGHSQAAPFLDDANASAQEGDARFRALAGPACEREILVALQPLSGLAEQWEALAAVIVAAPPHWRWWIRRHPASRARQDASFGRLLRLRQPNVVVDPPLVLPALLRHMSVLVSQRSGSAVEAAMFGVPSLFLDPAAPFPSLFEAGLARTVTPEALVAAISSLPRRPSRDVAIISPPIAATLCALLTR